MNTLQVKVQNEEMYFLIKTTKQKVPTQVGNTHLSISISLPKSRVFSISRQKKDEPNPSEMNIKKLIPARQQFAY